MIYIREYGFTPEQKAWWKQASEAERSSWMLMAPIRIAAQPVAYKGGGEGYAYMPTVHGVPFGLSVTVDTAEEAQRIGEEYLEKTRLELGDNMVALDLDALGIRGRLADEYATPDGQEKAFVATIRQELADHLSGKETKPAQA